jgi:hypothetical protein
LFRFFLQREKNTTTSSQSLAIAKAVEKEEKKAFKSEPSFHKSFPPFKDI